MQIRAVAVPQTKKSVCGIFSWKGGVRRKYSFSPQRLDALPEELAEQYRGLERELPVGISTCLRAAGALNEVTVQHIRALRDIMTGVNQLNQKYQEQSVDYLGQLAANVIEIVKPRLPWTKGLSKLF